VSSIARVGSARGTTLRLGWLLVYLVAFVIITRGISAEAQAAVHRPETTAPNRSGDPLLGSLSFTSSDEPVEVTADSLEFDYRTRVLIYRGNVVARQGDVQLSADSLTLDLSPGEKSELQSVVAEGNVHFSKGTRRATAGRAVYDQAKRLIVLSRNAVLSDERGNVSGDTVHVYLDDGRTVIEGGPGRVRAVLRPAASDGGENASAQPGAAEGKAP